MLKCYYNPDKQINTESLSELYEEKEWCCAFKAKLICEKKSVPFELEQHINVVDRYIQENKH